MRIIRLFSERGKTKLIADDGTTVEGVLSVEWRHTGYDEIPTLTVTMLADECKVEVAVDDEHENVIVEKHTPEGSAKAE